MSEAMERFIESSIRLAHHLPWCNYNAQGPRWKGGEVVLPECNCGLLEIHAERELAKTA